MSPPQTGPRPPGLQATPSSGPPTFSAPMGVALRPCLPASWHPIARAQCLAHSRCSTNGSCQRGWHVQGRHSHPGSALSLLPDPSRRAPCVFVCCRRRPLGHAASFFSPPPSLCPSLGSGGFQRLKAKLLESLHFYPPICSHLAGLGGGAARALAVWVAQRPLAAEKGSPGGQSGGHWPADQPPHVASGAVRASPSSGPTDGDIWCPCHHLPRLLLPQALLMAALSPWRRYQARQPPRRGPRRTSCLEQRRSFQWSGRGASSGIRRKSSWHLATV